MKTTASNAQAEQINKPNVNFNHRANVSQDGEFFNLHDMANAALQRAGALADLLETACEITDPVSFDPDTLWRAAQAIRFEIMDAQSLLSAYIIAEKAKSECAVADIQTKRAPIAGGAV